jgi:hypothetical protein
MPIREKSSYRKFEFVYESPDGDSCEITIVEHGDRRYIQFSQPNGDVVTMDGPMLLDMADTYREIIMSKTKPDMRLRRKSSKPNLRAPKLVDHRTAKAEAIESSVTESMSNYDDDVPPIQSFSPNEEVPNRTVDGVDYAKVQSGVDHDVLDEVGETPEEWSTTERSDLKGWQKEALERSNVRRPEIRRRGSAGANFKRIGAGELI